jgi:hypothetical protein
LVAVLTRDLTRQTGAIVYFTRPNDEVSRRQEIERDRQLRTSTMSPRQTERRRWDAAATTPGKRRSRIVAYGF